METLSGDPLGDPLRGRFSSRRLSVLLPLVVLSLNLSPTENLYVGVRFLENEGEGPPPPTQELGVRWEPFKMYNHSESLATIPQARGVTLI